VIIAVVLFMSVAWFVIRRKKKGSGRLKEYLEQKKLERKLADRAQQPTESAAPIDLPHDPASALDALAKSVRSGHDG
jgi:hypothetical protein